MLRSGLSRRVTSARVTERLNTPTVSSPLINLQLGGLPARLTVISMMMPAHLQGTSAVGVVGQAAHSSQSGWVQQAGERTKQWGRTSTNLVDDFCMDLAQWNVVVMS